MERVAVVHLTPCPESSTVASVRIAKVIAALAGCPLIDRDDASTMNLWTHQYETIILVNSPSAFSSILDDVARLIQGCKRLIWVMNDYNIYPPTQVRDVMDKVERVSMWTTVPEFPKRFHERKTYMRLFEDVKYINWNQLTYEPHLRSKPYPSWYGLFYYGAYRLDREGLFSRYLAATDCYPVRISCSPKAENCFEDLSPAIRFVKPLNPLIPGIADFPMSIYMEDEFSNRVYCSPANRFYECLAAGTAMVFDYASLGTMKTAGFDVSQFTVNDPTEVAAKIYDAPRIAAEQALAWGRRNYKVELLNQVKGELSSENLLCK